MNARPGRVFWKRGQATVEFALVLPVFCLFLFGIVEFGRMLLLSHTLTSAARTACRTATLPGSTQTDVDDAVTRFMQFVGYSQAPTVVISVADPDGAPRAGGLTNALTGDRVEVTVRMNYGVLTGGIVPALRLRTSVSGRCVFRHE